MDGFHHAVGNLKISQKIWALQDRFFLTSNNYLYTFVKIFRTFLIMLKVLRGVKSSTAKTLTKKTQVRNTSYGVDLLGTYTPYVRRHLLTKAFF